MSNTDYIQNKAIIYERYKDDFDKLTEEQIDTFRKEVEEAFFLRVYMSVNVVYVKGQPYKDHHELTSDIKVRKRLQISSDHNDSRLLPGEFNLQFRAVHDYLHYILQAPFTAVGEIQVYNLQKKLHESEISKQILFSEVVLQACYQEHFGRFAPIQKVVLYNGKI